jgi:hypothetical protein
MRFSTAAVGLLFGLEAAALKAVPRTVPEIERAVCMRDLIITICATIISRLPLEMVFLDADV